MVKVRGPIHLLEFAGLRLQWIEVVTVPGQHGKDVPVGTLRAILRSAGLAEKKED